MSSKYKKRPGTSGISGQLYETNLISLVLLKMQHDKSIEEFSLASNMDEIGAFDDICLKAKIADHDRPIFVFIQAKHKDDGDTFLQYELVKHLYTSYVKVKQNFYTSKDAFFKEKFDDIDILFILYTNAKYWDVSNNTGSKGTESVQSKQVKMSYESNFSDKLNDLIATGDNGSQAEYSDKDLNLTNDIIIEEEIATLSEHFAKFLNDKTNQSMNIMLDDYMLLYHVILANTIVDVSKIQTDEKNLQWRELTFRPEFFNSDNKIVKMLRKHIHAQVFKTQITIQVSKKKDKKVKQKGKAKDTADVPNKLENDVVIINNLIGMFLSEPSAFTLSPLIGAYIIYKSEHLEFTTERPSSDIQKLEAIELSPTIIEEAEEIAAQNIIKTLKIRVPSTFGNLDLAIGGNDKKVEKRLCTLTEFFADLCKTSKNIDCREIVVIDASVGEGFLSLTGGIGSAVGNLLVYEQETKLLKFTDNPETLQTNAQILYVYLISIINNLHLYRFDVKALVKFPKLVFDFIDEAKLILKKVAVYERQSNHKNVAELLNREVEKYHVTNQHNMPVKSETISINYHHEIQLWWMSQKAAVYLTKFKNKVGSFQQLYRQAINNIITEPQISAMQTTFYMTKSNYFLYTFSDETTDSLKLLEVGTQTIIVTDIPILTTIKVLQCLRDKYTITNAVLDLEYILNLKENDFDTLNSEIGKTDKVLIVMCNKINNSRILHRRLDQISKATEGRKLIVVTNNGLIETVQQYFSSTDIINDNKQSLVSLTTESQRDIIENTTVIFQGEKVSLNLLIDNKSVEFIKGAVFNKIVRSETITLGKSLSSSNYDEIKHLYVERKVSQTANNDDLVSDNYNIVDYTLKDAIHQIDTFYDINNDIVLITAKPGMGKSTLLTHLSLKTKEYDVTKENMKWIERINLLDHSKVFHNWQKDKIEIDTLVTLNFICQAILKNSLLDHSKVFYNWQKDIDIDTLETLKFICQAILKNNNIRISLEEKGKKVYLKHCTGDEWATFELNMFLHFYNERKLIFAFDGFDEICPHYKDSVINLFNVVRKCPLKNKLWVTSRPYSEILPDLEKVLGKAYEIEFIDDEEQQKYLDKYWQHKIITENFDDEQFKRIFASPDDFLGNLPSFQAEDTVYINLQRIYYHLRNYLYSKLSLSDKDKITTSLFNTVLYSSEYIDPSKLKDTDHLTTDISSGKINKFLGTPLLLYLLVEYFVTLIDDINSDKFKGNINVFVIYKQFIETKLKKILFQDKLKMDVYMPGIITRYEQDLTDCIIMHKKLAAHVIFQSSFLNKECRLFEFEEMRPFEHDRDNFEGIVNRFKTGTERTGLISYITPDNIPVFIHRTFAEYFAADYLADIFKSNKYDAETKKLLFITIYLFNTNDVFPWICRKRDVDIDLRNAITNDFISAIIFSICRPLIFNHRLWSIEQFIRIMASSTKKDYVNIPFVKHVKTQQALKGEERDLYLIKFQEELILKMQPGLKKHFITPRWPVNCVANCSTRYPTTAIRKHLDRIAKVGLPFPFGNWFK